MISGIVIDQQDPLFAGLQVGFASSVACSLAMKLAFCRLGDVDQPSA